MKFISTAVLAVTLMATPALATTTFAQYSEVDGGAPTIAYDNGVLTDTGGALGSVVLFNFLDMMAPGANDPMQAYLNVNSSGTPYSGTISFTRVSDMANLLTVSFTGASLFKVGTAGALLDSQPGGGTITYTSDFIDFTDQTAGDFALGFSGITGTSTVWTANSVGTFASDSSNVGGGGGVPEPASWAMMIVGFGGVGALMRRRRETAFA